MNLTVFTCFFSFYGFEWFWCCSSKLIKIVVVQHVLRLFFDVMLFCDFWRCAAHCWLLYLMHIITEFHLCFAVEEWRVKSGRSRHGIYCFGLGMLHVIDKFNHATSSIGPLPCRQNWRANHATNLLEGPTYHAEAKCTSVVTKWSWICLRHLEKSSHNDSLYNGRKKNTLA